MVTLWRQENPAFINKRNGFAVNNIIFISFYPDTWINLEMGDGTTKEFYFATTEKSFEKANDFCDSEGAILFEPKGLSMHLPINFNQNIYLSDLRVLFIIRHFYRSKLLVLFIVKNVNRTLFAV